MREKISVAVARVLCSACLAIVADESVFRVAFHSVGHRIAAAQQLEKALAIDPISDVVILSYSELLLAGVEDAAESDSHAAPIQQRRKENLLR